MSTQEQTAAVSEDRDGNEPNAGSFSPITQEIVKPVVVLRVHGDPQVATYADVPTSSVRGPYGTRVQVMFQDGFKADFDAAWLRQKAEEAR